MTKKTIAFLIESELEKAEVVLAARSMTDSIQKMAETAAKMEAGYLMPLNDPIREHFGPEAAAAFSEAVADKLRALVQTLSDTKNALSDEIARMQGEQVATPSDDLASMDDDALNSDEADSEHDADLDAAAAAEAATHKTEPAPAPRFNDNDLGVGNAAGRMRKESVNTTKTMLADTIVARQYAGLVREGKSPSEAATVITGTYGIDLSTLIEIMEDAKMFMDREYKGFIISKSASLSAADAPYRASGGGDSFRADSLAGIKEMINDFLKGN